MSREECVSHIGIQTGRIRAKVTLQKGELWSLGLTPKCKFEEKPSKFLLWITPFHPFMGAPSWLVIGEISPELSFVDSLMMSFIKRGDLECFWLSSHAQKCLVDWINNSFLSVPPLFLTCPPLLKYFCCLGISFHLSLHVWVKSFTNYFNT